ncbi:MAG TPA: trypsin-like peptidase domain-containing protein [Solirubrobacteraceae bacterium]|nr:trypsin-like peptidase domain-containing protein [Solirubrobacteraceae bacterium]
MSAKLALVLALVAALLGGCGGGAAQHDAMSARGDGGGTLAEVPGIYSSLEASVVAVIVRAGGARGEGSGVVVRPDKIVTNNHVVEGADEVSVALASGERLDARVIAGDPLTDLAVLDVARDDLPVPRFAGGQPEVGSLAVAIGNPLGFESSVTAGIVSGVDRSIPSGGETPALVGLIQTDAPISPGNSGGALVGADREVIGINVAYIPPQARAVAIGFAIPAPTVTSVVTALLQDGEVDHPYLGVQLRPVTAEIADSLGLPVDGGAAVSAIAFNGPAYRAGIRPGDIIIEIADRQVRAVEDVYGELRESGAPGRDVELELLRGGQRRSVTVTLGRRPRSGG